MTEADWNSCTNPQEMLDFLRTTGRASDRKLRLFACACCRNIPLLMEHVPSREAVEVAERYADGAATAGCEAPPAGPGSLRLIPRAATGRLPAK